MKYSRLTTGCENCPIKKHCVDDYPDKENPSLVVLNEIIVLALD
jgi:hypothetical protein